MSLELAGVPLGVYPLSKRSGEEDSQMKRLALAFALALAVSLTLLAGVAGASPRHGGFHGGHVTVFVGPGFQSACCVFIGPRHFFGHHHFFNNGFIDPRFGSSVIVGGPVVVVEPQPVWVPSSWWWNGFQWVWWPGHWAFFGQ